MSISDMQMIPSRFYKKYTSVRCMHAKENQPCRKLTYMAEMQLYNMSTKVGLFLIMTSDLMNEKTCLYFFSFSTARKKRSSLS